MPAPRLITDDAIATAVRLRMYGLRLDEIAARLGFSRSAIQRYTGPMPSRHQRRYSDADRAEAARLHAAGMPMTQIAKRIGCNVNSVDAWLSRRCA